MRVLFKHLTATMLATAALLPTACGDPTGPNGGSIAIRVTTAGATGDLDPNGYTLFVDGGSAPRVVGINGSLTIEDLIAGKHTIWLDGLASNCAVTNANPQTVNLADGDNAQVVFSVACSQRVGTIRLTTTTTGTEIDSDGYVISVPGYAAAIIPANGTLDLTNVPSGQRSVMLTGIAGNCVVVGPNPQTMTLAAGATINVAFVIQCAPSAALNVTTTTTGVSPDVDGYYVRLQRPDGGFVNIAKVGANGITVVPRLLAGTYKMEVLEIAANCDAITPNPGTVTLTTGATTELAVDIRCETPRELAFVNRNGPSGDIYIGFSSGGTATPVTTAIGEDVHPAWSPDGTRIAFSSSRDGNYEIYAISVNGTGTVRLTSISAHDRYPAWSPDGTRIAFMSERDGNSEIYVMNADGTNVVRLTNQVAFDSEPAWSPDGTRIAFRSDRDGAPGIWTMKPDGTGLFRVTSNSRSDWHPAWSPDGSRIAFSRGLTSSVRDIFIVNADGSGLTAVTQGLEAATDPAWSPDGRKIAFTSYSYYYSPYIAIYSINGVEHTPPITMNPGIDPAWRR